MQFGDWSSDVCSSDLFYRPVPFDSQNLICLQGNMWVLSPMSNVSHPNCFLPRLVSNTLPAACCLSSCVKQITCARPSAAKLVFQILALKKREPEILFSYLTGSILSNLCELYFPPSTDFVHCGTFLADPEPHPLFIVMVSYSFWHLLVQLPGFS